MAFATVAATATTITEPKNTTHVVNMDGAISSGDLLFIVAILNSTSIFTWPAAKPWVSLWADGADKNSECRYRIADGTEGSTVTLTSANKEAAFLYYRISASSWHGTTPPEVPTIATGTSVNPDPPSLTPSWGAEDTLWLAVFTSDEDATGETTDAYPTSYTNGFDSRTSSHVGAGSARRELSASPENPGTFTISVSQAWKAETIAIRPAGVGGLGIPLAMHHYRSMQEIG